MKLPKKYLTTNPNVMKREIKKHAHKGDDDSSAYGPWDADYKSRKAGVGKKVKTKQSKYTKKYKEMFGENLITDPFEFMSMLEDIKNEFIEILESLSESEIMEIEGFLNEGVTSPSSPVRKALKKKSNQTGFPQGILTQVWKRGYAAWKTGHIPGTTPQQWAMARVNSFVTGGKTTKMHDKKLYQQAKKNRKTRK
ncbi:hypothetical protein EBQ91_02420 [bacterium]|nr:hypothetical protein [bacterium]